MYVLLSGARNDTEKLLLQRLHAETVPCYHKALKSLLHHVHKNALQIASRIYLADGFKPNQEFLEESFKIYDSKPAALTDLEEINEWVEKSTNGHVTDFLSSLPPNLVMMLINAVHYKGCELEEKERFWSELDEVMESIPTGERVVIGADFNGHVGEGNRGDEEVMGKFVVKERNLEGQMVVDFAKRMDMAVVNTYFQKREEHRVTYKSGEEEVKDRDREENQVVKLKKEECCEEFRQKLRQALGGQVVLPDDWESTAEVIRETGRKVLGVSSGRRKEDKETWWWNEEVQDSIQRKRLAKKKWDMDRTEENRQEYKELQRRVKREVSKAKQKAYDELYTRLDTREREKDLYRLARQRDRDGKMCSKLELLRIEMEGCSQVRRVYRGDGRSTLRS
ncbi:hypothetical protein QTP70_007882 [Hemibagrus guttatus]|uniref:Serpin domain-containing protein n=1 Tax=Hemibagrus guttatus TaxID=175788 RepID=A0AAE0QRH3_9TELE|nr:hypothetical protein QTP70_007882 [Hemibagrus guttatus]